MKVLVSWLRGFAPFSGDPVALGDVLSDLGTPVESMERVGEGLDGIVVAKVLETRPIDGANKIHQVIVDAGDGEPIEIRSEEHTSAIQTLLLIWSAFFCFQKQNNTHTPN